MKKTKKKLVLAKETLRELEIPARKINGALSVLLCGPEDEPSVYWSCVPTHSGMYTCNCP